MANSIQFTILLILFCVFEVSGQMYWFAWSDWTTCRCGQQTRTRTPCNIDQFVYWETCFDKCNYDDSDVDLKKNKCSASCVGAIPEGVDISYLEPVISMHRNNKTGNKYYTCNFTSSAQFDSKLLYKVEWLLTSMGTHDIRLKSSNFTSFTNEADFNSAMSLTEIDLLACGFGQTTSMVCF